MAQKIKSLDSKTNDKELDLGKFIFYDPLFD